MTDFDLTFFLRRRGFYWVLLAFSGSFKVGAMREGIFVVRNFLLPQIFSPCDACFGREYRHAIHLNTVRTSSN